MAQVNNARPKKESLKKIFISWSGDNSKQIAKELKNVLENIIFENTNLNCFVSDIDIASGTDWWNKIKSELKSCMQGILCITKENINAPWIYYEAGAMVAREVPTIPLLVNCGVASLSKSPIKGNQCVDFYDINKFLKMIRDINNKLSLVPISEQQLDVLAKSGYDTLKANLSPVLKNLKDMRTFNEKYIYPNTTTTVKINTVFISAPMASIDDVKYKELREYILSIKNILIEDIGFNQVHSPMFANKSQFNFDGKTKAIKDNFANLKSMDSLIVIYPQKLPSSALVEIGYGIALCKRMVVFYKEGLPYILEEAAGTIKHIKTFKFDTYDDITQVLTSNGMDIFEGEGDE